MLAQSNKVVRLEDPTMVFALIYFCIHNVSAHNLNVIYWI
jgi:hypothetical protein